jgi:twinkle protein
MGFINTHLPCEECGSSDGLAVNEDESSKCFVCGTFTPGRNNQHNKEQNTQMQQTEQHRDTPQFIQGDVMALPNRGLHKDVCQRYDYRIGEHNGKPCHVATYRNPERTIVSQKVRFEGKDFTSIGSPTYFWGQHLWPNGGKRLTITEGEIDCLTVAQVVGEGKWPVVSLPSGAQGAKRVFQKQMKWLEKFDEVILMFDNDEPGNAAAEACSHVLPAGTCKIARLTMKDPNELLMEGRSREIVDAYWQAKVWRPDTIMDGAELFDRLTTSKVNDSVPYPWDGLNDKTHGLRLGEIVTLCAGSGIGKSAVAKELAHHLLKHTNKKIGYIALEESIERTANSIIGLEMNKLLHLEPIKVDDDYRSAFDNTVGSGRVFFYDHWGSLDSDNLLNHIRYMAKALGVQYLVLDHLSIVVSGLDGGDERRLIDNTMTKLRALVEECGIGLVLVSHLKRPEGRGHENGAETTLAQLRGSAAIAQLSDMVLGLERDQQDAEARNITNVRVLKNRFSGDTGLAVTLRFSHITGRLTEEEIAADPVEAEQTPFS